MDISNIKDILKKLSFFRDYSSLVVPVIILLVAVIVIVLTPLLIGSKLEAKLRKESVAVGKKVLSLSQKPIARNQWEVEKRYQDSYAKDANQISLLALRTTQRELLSYKIFPAPKSTSVFIFNEFGQKLRERLAALISGVNARDCPTPAELQRNLSASSSMAGRLTQRRSSSTQYDITILEVLCREKAESARFYANPSNFGIYEFWGRQSVEADARRLRTQIRRYTYTGIEDSVKACWYSQLAYWIIEDIINTINELDKRSNSVFTSPVKRLLRVNFLPGGSGTSSDDKPRYVLTTADAFVTPLTARKCDDNIDVVHFNLSVVVSNKAVLEFMRELCSAKKHKFRGFFGNEQERTFEHNQITILESRIWPVDRQDATHNMYRYGEDAVVQLNLVCEYIFNKAAYDGIKPDVIKTLFQSEEESESY